MLNPRPGCPGLAAAHGENKLATHRLVAASSVSDQYFMKHLGLWRTVGPLLTIQSFALGKASMAFLMRLTRKILLE
jgi:hypothetical protein